MRRHTEIYLKHFGYSTADTILCEVSSEVAVDIHHIFPRGRGGSKERDIVENLMAVSRRVHIEYGDKTEHRLMLLEKHEQRLQEHGKPYNEQFFIDAKAKIE